jgi:hypothetical protein
VPTQGALSQRGVLTKRRSSTPYAFWSFVNRDAVRSPCVRAQCVVSLCTVCSRRIHPHSRCRRSLKQRVSTPIAALCSHHLRTRARGVPRKTCSVFVTRARVCVQSVDTRRVRLRCRAVSASEARQHRHGACHTACVMLSLTVHADIGTIRSDDGDAHADAAVVTVDQHASMRVCGTGRTQRANYIACCVRCCRRRWLCTAR